jgi:hypothetical protein
MIGLPKNHATQESQTTIDLNKKIQSACHMKKLNSTSRKNATTFFKTYEWNYLPESILDGYMGEVWVDHESQPSFAVLELPKLKLYIIGGRSNHSGARDFIANLSPFSALIFESEGWERILKEIFADRIIELQRFAYTGENLSIPHLSYLASRIPEGYQLKQIDLELACQLADEESVFASDHLINFESPEDFIGRGFGFCILDGDKIVSAASTFVISSSGIEIQINTREKYRRAGLATIVAAHLILHSLQKGLDPNWDAANEKSGRLAEKLGYTPRGNYAMWFLTE